MSLHIFDKNQHLFKIIKRENLLSLEQELELSTIDTLYAEVGLKEWESLKKKPYYMGVVDPLDPYSYFIYRIMEEGIQSSYVALKGVHVGYDELKGRGYVPDITFTSADVPLIFGRVLKGTGWRLGYVDSMLGRYTFDVEMSTRLDALRKVLEVIGAEVKFKITIKDNKISDKRIEVYRKIGGNKGRRFSYGSELIEVVREENLSEIVTALRVVGKDIQVPPEMDGDEPTTEPLSIQDIEWSVGLGNPIDKPKGEVHIELKEMTKIYGYPDGTARMGVFEDTSAETPEELLDSAYEALVELSRPKVQFRATVSTKKHVDLGETVAIVRPDLNFMYQTRVFKIRRNLLNGLVEDIEFGDVLVKSEFQRYKELSGNITQESERLENVIQISANGKNRIFRGPNEPTMGMIVGDLWYKPIGDGDTELYQWDGEMWVLVVSTGVNSQVQEELDEAEERIQDARDNALEIDKKADSILKGLGVEPLGKVHPEIVEGIQGKFDSVTSTFDEKVGGLSTDINVFTGQVNNRLNSISGKVDLKPDKVYVDTSINRATGEIQATITGITERPGETIFGYSAMKSTVDGNFQEIARVSRGVDTNTANYQTVMETAEAFEREIGRIKTSPTETIFGYNTLKNTAEGNTSEIARIKRSPGELITGYNNVKETADMFERIIGKTTETDTVVRSNVARMVMSADIFQTEIKDAITGVSTSVTQLNDSWAMSLRNGDDIVTSINASNKGVYVKGKYITLDGDVDVAGDFTLAGKFITRGIKADNITVGTLNGANLNVININAQSIVGENANLIRASFNAIQDNLQIDGSGIHMIGSGTWRRTYLTATGFDLYNSQGGSGKAGAVGYFKEHQNSATADENFVRGRNQGSSHYIGIGANRFHNVVLGFAPYTTVTNGYNPALTVDGVDGKIRIYTDLHPANSGYSVKLTARDGNGLFGASFESRASGIVFSSNGTWLWDEPNRKWAKFTV